MDELFLIDTGVLLNILFSIGFVLIGSLAFHISALVSGHDIYRDLPTHESTLLSIVAGIVIFLFSPISFIIFTNTNACYANILVQILDFRVLLAFFGSALGLGLIFGCVAILKARVNILKWFRDKSGMVFWISYYGFVWDDFFRSAKWKGEVFVQTDNEMFKGLLESYSIREEEREIVLKKPKIKGDGWEEKIEGEENVGLLIPGSKIKRIIIPERSFKKHFEPMGHISQAFYCQIIAIGLFFLSYSAYLTGLELESLKSFYDGLSLFFLVATIFVLCVSVWVAQKDFDNWRSFLVLSPPIAFVPLFFSLLSVLLIIFDMKISQALVLIFALAFISPLYGKIINWLGKHKVEDLFDEIKENFKNWKSFLLLPSSRTSIIFGCAFFLLLLILFILLITQISPVLIFMAAFFLSLLNMLIILITQISPVVIFIFVLSLLYITISNWLKKPLNDCFDKIKKDFEDTPKLLKDVIQEFYLQLSCNEKEKIEDIKDKILEKYENDGNTQKIETMINDLKKLRDEGKCGDKNRNINVEYLKNEDFNIIYNLKVILKKVKG